MTFGGEGALGFKKTVEQRKILSIACMGRKHSDATKRKLSLVHTNPSALTRSKMSAAHSNPSLETRRKIGEKSKGRIPWNKNKQGLFHHTNEHKQNIASWIAKEYIITTPVGEKIEIVNLSDFCKSHDLNVSKMSAVANGRRNHHKHYTCKLKDKNESLLC